MDRLDLASSARPFSLCLVRNAALQPVDKAALLERLPPSVRDGPAALTSIDPASDPSSFLRPHSDAGNWYTTAGTQQRAYHPHGVYPGRQPVV